MSNRGIKDIVETIVSGCFYDDYDQSSSDLRTLREVSDLHDRMLGGLTQDATVTPVVIEGPSPVDGFVVQVSGNFPQHEGIYEFDHSQTQQQAIYDILHFAATLVEDK